MKRKDDDAFDFDFYVFKFCCFLFVSSGPGVSHFRIGLHNLEHISLLLNGLD